MFFNVFGSLKGVSRIFIKFKLFNSHSISNNKNDIDNTNIIVNTDGVSDNTIEDSLHKDVLSISEQLRNMRAEHHSKYLESKLNKDTNTKKPLDTTSYVTPVLQKDNLPSGQTQLNGQKVPSAE